MLFLKLENDRFFFHCVRINNRDHISCLKMHLVRIGMLPLLSLFALFTDWLLRIFVLSIVVNVRVLILEFLQMIEDCRILIAARVKKLKLSLTRLEFCTLPLTELLLQSRFGTLSKLDLNQILASVGREPFLNSAQWIGQWVRKIVYVKIPLLGEVVVEGVLRCDCFGARKLGTSLTKFIFILLREPVWLI